MIDDASHLDGPTKLSFEIIWPYVSEGGLYIIEDWAWEHWKDVKTSRFYRTQPRTLTDFVVELLAAVGSSPGFIESIVMGQGFVVIQKPVLVELRRRSSEAKNPLRIEDLIVRDNWPQKLMRIGWRLLGFVQSRRSR